MSIIVSRRDVSCTDYNNQYVGHLEEVISRELFEAQFGIMLGIVQTLAYEPDRNIFHIERNNQVEVYLSPNEDALMAEIAAKEDLIKDHFENEQLKKGQPSPYHELVNKVWTITPENQEKWTRELFERDFRSQRDELLAEADILIFKAEDTGQDATALRAYRQALRDATDTWVLPEKPANV